MPDSDAWWGAPGCYQVVDGIHRIPLSMPNDGLRAVNVYAVDTADGLLLVDGGWAVPSAVDELESALRTIGRSPQEISDVLVTHIHRDHYTFAVRLRERYGPRVHLGRLERPGLVAIQELGNNVPVSSLRELRRSGAEDLGTMIEKETELEPYDVDDWADPDGWLDAGPLDDRRRVDADGQGAEGDAPVAGEARPAERVGDRRGCVPHQQRALEDQRELLDDA